MTSGRINNSYRLLKFQNVYKIYAVDEIVINRTTVCNVRMLCCVITVSINLYECARKYMFTDYVESVKLNCDLRGFFFPQARAIIE